MNSECLAFRERLVAALEPRRRGATLDELGWHEHLLACAECRSVLAAEEALELLLDSLPDPKLPRALAERVLARLRVAPSHDRLDALLEQADPAIAPPALASRVLAGLAAARAERREAPDALERLLDLVPNPDVPAELGTRTLAKLAFARRRRTAFAAPRLWLAAAAAAVIVTGGAWTLRIWLRQEPRNDPAPIVENAPDPLTPQRDLRAPQSDSPVRLLASDSPPRAADSAATPSDELLASLSVLESWELLNSENIDVMLSSLDASDELLLELASELTSDTEESPEPAPVEEPKNG